MVARICGKRQMFGYKAAKASCLYGGNGLDGVTSRLVCRDGNFTRKLAEGNEPSVEGDNLINGLFSAWSMFCSRQAENNLMVPSDVRSAQRAARGNDNGRYTNILK